MILGRESVFCCLRDGFHGGEVLVVVAVKGKEDGKQRADCIVMVIWNEFAMGYGECEWDGVSVTL